MGDKSILECQGTESMKGNIKHLSRMKTKYFKGQLKILAVTLNRYLSAWKDKTVEGDKRTERDIKSAIQNRSVVVSVCRL